MRRAGPPSEIGRLAAPLAQAADVLWQRMHWWIGLMAIVYACSGLTIIKPDEVAIVLRWGRLLGETAAQQEHGSGLLLALPRPIDTVIRVPVKHVYEVDVAALAPTGESSRYALSLDPLTEGYAVTGDQNILHANIVARYRIRDAAEWALYGPPPDDVLRTQVTAAMVRSLGEMAVDRVLADERTTLIGRATTRAQAGLDAAHAGLELVSLELTRLSPPDALAADFNDVQTAFITAETRRQEARAYAEGAVPQAKAFADGLLQAARGAADAERAKATGDAAAFVALVREYRANPRVVRERLYRDAIDRATGTAGSVQWIPPPPQGSKYHGLRISIPSAGAAPPSIASGDGDEH